MFKKYRLGKKKILLYYFLAIVLPSIILGVLAFRGIMNDQAIREKEDRQILGGIPETDMTASLLDNNGPHDLIALNGKDLFIERITTNPRVPYPMQVVDFPSVAWDSIPSTR